MEKVIIARLLRIAVSFLCVSMGSSSALADYRKATEGREVVMNKLYPKSERLELGLPAVGFLMNQSYVNTALLGVDASYFLNETTGFSFVFNQGVNQDKGERTCIESFFYDPSNEVGVPCDGPGVLAGADKNNDEFPRYGPAYVPIREIQQLIFANFLWTPVYGKQLVYMGATSYFDLFVELGGGVAMSNFYPKQAILRNGNVPRDKYTDPSVNPELAAEKNAKIGAKVTEVDSYGVEGRPTAQQDTNPVINIGLGQKFHFGKMFHFKTYIRNITLIGTDNGFENLFALYGGIGFRF